MPSLRRFAVSEPALPAAPKSTAPEPPREERRVDRRRVYLGEGLVVCLRTESGAEARGEIIDLTPEGLGIAILDGEVPERGAILVIEHTGRATSGLRHRAVVTSVAKGTFGGQQLPRIGVAILQDRTKAGTARDRRAAERYACTDESSATASAPSPLFFREWLNFRVSELGAGGMTVTTSLRNKSFLPGMELTFGLVLESLGTFQVRGRIMSVTRDVGGKEFRVGVRWLDPPKNVLTAIAEYLLVDHKDLTPQLLRAGGLPVGNVDRAVTYDYADMVEEYDEILALRLKSHQAEGRLEGVSLAEMRSPYDAHSRHLVCRFGDRIVGYVRVIYVDGQPEKSQYVSAGGHDVPEWLWKAGFVEAGAGATDPDFQRAGLFVPLMQHAARVALQSGYRYMLGACDDELLGMYRAMGFTLVETREVEPKPGWKFRSHLIALDIRDLPEEGKLVPQMAKVAEFVG